MSTPAIIFLAASCFVLGLIACALIWTWCWARYWARSLEDERQKIEADAERIGQQIEEARESIHAGARRSKGRFQL